MGLVHFEKLVRFPLFMKQNARCSRVFMKKYVIDTAGQTSSRLPMFLSSTYVSIIVGKSTANVHSMSLLSINTQIKRPY